MCIEFTVRSLETVEEGKWYLYVIDGYGQGFRDVDGSGC